MTYDDHWGSWVYASRYKESTAVLHSVRLGHKKHDVTTYGQNATSRHDRPSSPDLIREGCCDQHQYGSDNIRRHREKLRLG